MAKINRSRVAWFLTISALAAVAVVAAHKGGHHAHVPKDKAHANVDPSKAGDCPFNAAGGAGAVANTKEKGGDDQEMRILPIFDKDGNIAGSKAEDAKKDRVLVNPRETGELTTDTISHYGSEIELTDQMREARRPGS